VTVRKPVNILVAIVVGGILGTLPLWFNDSSMLWPSARYDDYAQWTVEQLSSPGFLFSTLIGHGAHTAKVIVAFNVTFYGVIAYLFLVKPPAKS
jgi:hypothetical protein